MSAQVCPVCEGKTTVRKGFYKDGSTNCKGCFGRGVVFDPYNYVPQPQPVSIPWQQPWWPNTMSQPTTTVNNTPKDKNCWWVVKYGSNEDRAPRLVASN